jgi:hypothetical protein
MNGLPCGIARVRPGLASSSLGGARGRRPQARRSPEGNHLNYQSYIEDLKRRKGADADQPHRIAYKKLVHGCSATILLVKRSGRSPSR